MESCQLDDPNEVGLKETAGYDVLGGISLLCHYTSRALEEDEKSKEFLLSISDHRRTLALPEEVTVFVNDDKVEIIGDRPYFYFEKGEILENYFQNH